jgi:nitrite reductase/ring-hydroxylating ferredoxin subunit
MSPYSPSLSSKTAPIADSGPRARDKIRESEEAPMARFVKVGARADFERVDGGTLVEAGGQRIALFKLADGYHAIEDTCPHAGGPLSEGPLDGDVVTCPWHGSRFDVKTGALLAPPATRGVKSFRVQVNGDDVEVEII